MARKNRKKEGWVDAMIDGRQVTEAMMAVDQNLQKASVACRALVHDAGVVKDPAFAKSMRKLLAMIDRMKAGPNVAVWDHIYPIENTASAGYKAEEEAEKSAESNSDNAGKSDKAASDK